jgi:hypothetical protein
LPAEVPDLEEMIPVYKLLASAMAPYVDLYLAETMSTSREVCVLPSGSNGAISR